MKNIYLDLIRYSIHPKMKVPVGAEKINWNDFMAFCNRQNVMGIVFEGLDRSKLPIPSNIVLQWFSFSEKIKSKNRLVNIRQAAISNYFKNKGLRSCILKGQANSLMYPNPELRSSGDIDLWVEGKASEIIKIVQKECPTIHYSIHHTVFPLLKDVSVEIHYRPVYLQNWFKDKKLRQYIEGKENEQFANQKKIGENIVGTLTDDFNLVFQMIHMYNHFFSSRNNMKQLMDYFFLLKKWHADTNENERSENNERIVKLLKELGVSKYASGVMWILKDVLDLEKECLLVEPDEIIGKVIIRESLRFGIDLGKSKCALVYHQCINNIKLIPYFPKEVLINPLFLIWHQWWKAKMALTLRKS